MSLVNPISSLLNPIFLRAHTDPNKPAILLPDRVITYRMLAKGVLSVEKKLLAAGVKGHQLAAVDIANPARHIIVVLALWRLGIASVSVRSDLIAPALRVGCKLLFSEILHVMPPDVRQFNVTDDWFVQPTPDFVPHTLSAFQPDDVFRVAFTSGSTGTPKAMAHSEAGFSRAVLNRLPITFEKPWTRLLLVSGMSSSFVLKRTLLTLSLGLTVCFAGSTEDAIRMVSHNSIDVLMGTPRQILDILEVQAIDRAPLPSLSSIQVLGGQLSDTLLAKLQSEFAAEITETYSSTEGSVAGVAAGDLIRRRNRGEHLFAPLTRIEAVDDQMNALPPGTEGSIRIWADSLASPYSGSRTCATEAGWFVMGDIGIVHADGLFSISGRKPGVINTGGVKINPEYLENIIAAHPDVADVGVMGVASGGAIVEILAVVVAKRKIADSDLLTWLSQRSPEAVADRVVFADSIPRTDNGKIKRSELERLWGKAGTA